MQYLIKDSRNARDVALFALLNITDGGRKGNVFLRETLDRQKDLEPRDRALCEHIVSGTLDRLFAIDEVIGKYSKTPVSRLNPYIRGILRLSVCQLLYMDRIPASAAINEGTELAKKHGLTGLSGFVNGVLRNVSRDSEKSASEDNRLKRVMEEGHIRYSVPKWLYVKLADDFGIDAAEKLFASWLMLRKTSVRFNLSKGLSEEEIVSLISADGIRSEKILSDPVVYELSGLSGVGVASLKAFSEGYITVQDASAAMSLALCPPEKGSFVVDLCAAPGGKSLAFADAMAGTGTVDSRDVSEQKIHLIAENAERCGFANIRTSVRDALKKDKDIAGKADIVIADLPCSGLGVVAKKPDIKKNITPETITDLRNLQREILKNAVTYVRSGGRLLYSTCTVTKEENEENAMYIAEAFSLKPLVMKRIMPDEHHDGFFIAVFLKPDDSRREN